MKKKKEKRIGQITDLNIQEYALEMTTPESPEVQGIVSSSEKELDFTDMLSGNLVGQLLKMLIKLIGANRVLEIGTFTGYSSLTMAQALPDEGEVITIEMNLLYQEISEKHFQEYDKDRKIRLMKGDARKLLDEIEGTFDLVFLDADKISYQLYFRKVLPKIKQGGLLLVDNSLWGGSVLDPDNQKSKALHNFNKLVANENKVEQVLLPVRDGVTIIRKK